LLVEIVPGLGTIRMPARFVVIAQLGFALLAAVGAEGLSRRIPRRLVWPAAIAAAALALWTFSPLPPLPIEREQTAADLAPAYSFRAANGGGRRLLEIPAPSPVGAARRMYLSTFHWLPIVDGYSAYWPATPSLIHDIARSLPSDGALQELVDTVDLGWIL